MKICFLSIALLFVFATFGQQQPIAITAIDSVRIEADAFAGRDIYGASYFIENNALIKIYKAKDWQYKSTALGKIAKVDLQNPLSIVVFYENFNTVVLLDNQLNETRRINLSENEVPIVASAVGLVFGNRLWIFNTVTQRIGLLDYVKNEFQPITAPFKGRLKYYKSDFNYFQWIDENDDWYRCDVYGKVTVVGKVPQYDALQLVSDNKLLFKKDNRLYYFSVDGNKPTLIDFGKKTFESFSYNDQILSIFTRQGITNYKIKLP